MSGQPLPVEKSVSVLLTENDIICIAQSLTDFNNGIDKTLEALAQGPVSGFSYELLVEYYKKRKAINVSIMDKLKKVTI